MIFDSFAQVDSSATRRYDGSGLGLAICKQLVLLLHGEIHVRSELGKGAEFWFEVPVKISKKKRNKSLLMNDENLQNKMAQAHILLVEDNAINQKVCINILQQMGCKSIEIANNGLEAVETVQNTKLPLIDIILMDVMMPVMDGIDAIKAIRTLEHEGKECRLRPNVSIIGITANDMKCTKEKLLRCGADHYLTKPIIIPELAPTLLTCLSKRETL
jgi:CheY-like chemotaxis protein